MRQPYCRRARVSAGQAAVAPHGRGRFDTTGFLSPHSDVAALLVLEHQAAMTNFITRLGWEAPHRLHPVADAATALVDISSS
jgi:hypothetical protein